ncbi:MAG: alkene reductase [Bacteroidales bacterium]
MGRMHTLFEPYQIGEVTLSNRVVMAPMTRRRATEPSLKANDLIAEYYLQRASAGLIIAEGSQISPQAFGYTGTPGCYTSEQVEGWRLVTEKVHDAGGKIFLQLWHVGPYSHPLLQPEQKAPVAASSVCPQGEVLTPEGRLPYESSRPISDPEIRNAIRDFGLAAKNAMEAGFDGVEIHGAHAYLIDQFIMDGTNHRTDEYGGTVENRARFLFEVIDEVLKHAPASRTGLRLSPRSVKPGMADSQPEQTYGYIIGRLNQYQLAYLHLSEMMTPEERLSGRKKSIVPYYRNIYNGTLVSCGGHSGESARQMLDQGYADLIAFGKPFISNPDLVRRLKEELPLAEPDKDTFYHGGPKGFVDYPEWT